jgi:hypothetical protein
MSLTSKTGFIAGVSVLALSGVSFAGGPAEANDYSSFLQDAGGVSWSALVQMSYSDDNANIDFGKIQGTVSGSAGGWDFVVQDEFSSSSSHDLEEVSASTSFSGVGVKLGTFRPNWSRTTGMGDGGHFNTGGGGTDAGFEAGYVDGFELSYGADAWRVTATWEDTSGSDDEWGNTFRGEFLASGTWGQFDDFGAASGGGQGIMIGYSQREDDDTILDVSYESDGFGIMYQVHTDDAGVTGDSTFWQGSYNMSADTTLWVQMEEDEATSAKDNTKFGVSHQYGAGALITVQHTDDGTDSSVGAQLQLSF